MQSVQQLFKDSSALVACYKTYSTPKASDVLLKVHCIVDLFLPQNLGLAFTSDACASKRTKTRVHNIVPRARARFKPKGKQPLSGTRLNSPYKPLCLCACSRLCCVTE